MPQPDSVSSRIASIDIVRGLIMVIMALDHVREFFGSTPFRAEDVSQTSVPLFFSRWITHLCAPNFVFLSGISIYLYLQKKGDLRSTALFLLTRGIWLVVLEIVLISFLLQLSYQLILLQVIWVIGWSMILFSALIWLSPRILAVIALLLLVGHNVIPDSPTTTPLGIIAGLLLNSPFVISNTSGWPFVLAAYTVLPWLGLMIAGYCLGPWMLLPTEQTHARLWRTGAAMVATFVLLRLINVFGDPVPWAVQSRGAVYTLLSFINVTKYPPSLLFDLLMVGIGLMLLAAFTRVRTRITEWLQVFGQVPFFYYILHLGLISGAAWAWTHIAFGQYVNLGFTAPSEWPDGYSHSLPRVLVVWVAVVIILYFPCRWFANYRRGHRTRWLSYF